VIGSLMSEFQLPDCAFALPQTKCRLPRHSREGILNSARRAFDARHIVCTQSILVIRLGGFNMSFELRLDKPLRKEIRRIVKNQLEKVLEEIDRAPQDAVDEAVHEARKCLKKVRAVLRLVRPKIGESEYHAQNVRFRDAARPLTEVRDAKILVESLGKLSEHYAADLRDRNVAAVRERLVAREREVCKRVLDEQKAFAAVKTAVSDGLELVKDWTGVPDKWSSIGDGLRQTYRRGRRGFAAAAQDPKPESLHEWRKQTKYLHYQLQVLRPLHPEAMDLSIAQSDRLGELLGDDHDLVLLAQVVTDEPTHFGDEPLVELLSTLIEHRRKQLEQEADLLGQHLFQETPKEFGRRVRAYWRAWHKRSSAQPSQPSLA
jgi:CHAD domain-containing protein